MMRFEKLAQLAEKLRSFSSVVVATHLAPDPDALGSATALALGLGKLGISATVYCHDEVHSRVAPFIKGIRISNTLPSAPTDALIVVDTASKQRVSRATDEVYRCGNVIVNIDHHFSNELWGDFNFVDSDAAASAEIVLQLLEELKVSIDQEMANLLFIALMDDTGSFRFSNTDSAAFRAAERLVDYGASPAETARVLYYSLPQRVLQLRAKVMTGMKLVANGQVVLVCASRSVLESCKASAEDTEGIVDEARLIEGTIGAIFMREIEDGWKFSLRSKDDSFDVNEIAAVFGGGGHRAAAGCKLSGAQAEAEQRMVAAVERAIAKLKRG